MSFKLYRFDYLAVQHQTVMVYATDMSEARAILMFRDSQINWPLETAHQQGVVTITPPRIIGGVRELSPQCVDADSPEENELWARGILLLGCQIETAFVEGQHGCPRD